jgi:hypothetical protein
MRQMTNAEIHAQIDRLVDEGRFEEALKLVDELEPISAEEFQRILDNAPIDDEPVTPEDERRLAEAHAIFAGMNSTAVQRQAG